MSKKTLNAENLIDLGVEKLAELLLEISRDSADMKRRLRLELIHGLGAKELASEIRKRLTTIKRSQSFIDWKEQRTFVRELETQLGMIKDKIAPDHPTLAFDLLWQFMALAESVYVRVDDSDGDVGSVFHYVLTLLEEIGPNIGIPPTVLAEKVFEAVLDNDYGQYDGLIHYLGPALGEMGLKVLKSIVQNYENEPLTEKTHLEDGPILITGGGGGYPLDHSRQEEYKAWLVRDCLQQIADQLGDVDAYIAQYTPEDLLNPRLAVKSATRLLAVERNTEALNILTSSRDLEGSDYFPREWNFSYAEALEKLGRTEELRNFRWQCFEKALDTTHLRDLLKSLPDFDDIETEERAKDLAMQYPNFNSALEFFLEWPDLRRAADLIVTRFAELDGNMYYSLTPAADRLQGDFSLAAVLARRAMINHTLERGKATRYKHSVRHLLECQSADNEIDDYKGFATHGEFEAQLRANHSKKASFWSKLD